ncbi:deoxyguanosinetriphosphate triphosphohydrolase [Alphaproteobacteria bacterium]|nr:deoxyguanosinetriphosphate triphosphohydrolase [Alphaproteobacteria bacterium]
MHTKDNSILMPYACHSNLTKGRFYEDDALVLGRTEYQRDRDRIIHSEAFRRLKDKTQVFIFQSGDHFRTRLTHTIEVAQIARSISRALNLNEDLTETIALAHDLGHPPLGHKGEAVLKELMTNFNGFDHNEQSIRVVTVLEKKYPSFNGLNLTMETLEGLIKHNGPYRKDKKIPHFIIQIMEKFSLELQNYPSLEGQVANISDDIAYLTHDFDDGLRENLFTLNDLKSIALIKSIIKDIESTYSNIQYDILIHQLIRKLVSYFINDIICNSQEIIGKNYFRTVEDIRNHNDSVIKLTSTANDNMQEIRYFLFKNMYHNKLILDKLSKYSVMIKKIFYLFQENISLLPTSWRNQNGHSLNNMTLEKKSRVITDYIAGMTDNYLKMEYMKFFKEEY